jgi:two-component system nitrogen regulation response regulator NtrX
MENGKPLVLVVDDDPHLCEILAHILALEGYATASAHTGEEALRAVRQAPADLVLLDLKLPDAGGLDILSTLRRRDPPVPVIMISGEGTIRTAVKAVGMGAYDFLEKPLDPDRVLLTIRNALERSRLEDEKASLLRTVAAQYEMIGESEAMRRVHEWILKAGRTGSKVLIEGENGTGKELVARAVHHAGPKAGKPFVAVNCAAIPETLIESELFGYRKGAFTGAVADRPGKFQSAEGGTLFLDEIGDMSPVTQAKVLRAVEADAVEPVGSSAPVRTDVRLIAATNKDLQREMSEGRFREDLYFRLNVLNIRLPALRERREDIPLLVEHYVRHFCQEHGIILKMIEPSAMEHLSALPWAGNVRELKNFTEKMVVLIDREEIQKADLLPLLRGPERTGRPDDSSPLTLHEAKERFECSFIKEKLEAAGWNVTKAAEALGLPRTYLHRKMKQLGLGG